MLKKVPGEEGHKPTNAIDLRLYLIVLEVAGQGRVMILDNNRHHLEDHLQTVEVLPWLTGTLS